MKLLNMSSLVATLALSRLPVQSTNAGSFVPTNGLSSARQDHTATLLANGTVLVAGGDYLSSAELYNPSNGTWSATGALSDQRAYHTATLLPDGNVMLAGGETSDGNGSAYPTASVEFYSDSALPSWSETGALTNSPTYHQAVLLGNGKVLAMGGVTSGGGVLADAYLYDSSTGS